MDHAAVVEGFAKQQVTTVAGGTMAVVLNVMDPLQDGIQGDTLSPIAVVL